MNRIAHLRTSLLFPLLFLIASCQNAVAQDVSFTASANAARIGMNDQLQVTYTIEDGDGSGLNGLSLATNAALKDFKILAGPFRSQGTNVQIVGNQMVQSVSYSATFVVQARHLGVIRMAPAEASDNAGHSYRSNVLQIEVVSGTVASAQQRHSNSFWDDDPFFGGDPFAALRAQQARMLQAARGQQRQVQPAKPVQASKVDLSKDLFIKVDVDKTSVRLGEQVTAVYKLYARVPMQVAISKLPSLNGFWNQDFDIPKQQKPVEEIVDGRRYQVFLLKKSALFPQQVGSLTLDAAEAEGVAHIPVQAAANPVDDPFAMFGSLMMNDPFFSDPYRGVQSQETPVHLKSAPVKIQVSELPVAGKPENFGGAVGKFSLTTEQDLNELTTDQVATIKLTISGSGNLKLFDAPKINLPEGLDIYDPNILDTITGRTTTISGQKIVTYSIAPHKSGHYEIPPITLNWYNPETGKYESAATNGFTLDVHPGKNPVAASKLPGGFDKADIDDRFQPSSSHAIILSPVYWMLYILPLMLLFFLIAYRRKQDQEAADLGKTRIRQANKVARKRLTHAGEKLQKNDARGFYDEISKAIWLYLSDKLNIPISSLGKDATLLALGTHGVPTPIQQQIEKVLGECELALYASDNNHQMQQTFSEAACIITGLERTLRAS
jgi:hypothetical protein